MKDSLNEQTVKHLEFIQSVVTRLNGNSFQIKGLAITLVSAFLGIYASTKEIGFVAAALFPTVIFWFLDTYYLWQERKFRGLYNDVAGVSSSPQAIKPFAMRPDLYRGGSYHFFAVFFSPTILWVYLPIAVFLVVFWGVGLATA